MTSVGEKKAATPESSWRDLALVGELLLLAFSGLVFGYFVFMSLTAWPSNSARVPLLTAAVGIPMWLIRAGRMLRGRRRVLEQEPAPVTQLMDIGFTLGEDPAAEKQRFLRFLGTFGLLVLGIWLLGAHLTIPVWVALYLYRYGEVRPRNALIAGLSFLGVIVGLFDIIIATRWHVPLLLRVLGIEFRGF